MVIDAVLAFLGISPQHGVGDFAYDNKFLVSAEDIAFGNSEIVREIERCVSIEAKAVKSCYFSPYEISESQTSVRDYCDENDLSILVVLRMANKFWPGQTIDGGYMLNCYQLSHLSRSIGLLSN